MKRLSLLLLVGIFVLCFSQSALAEAESPIVISPSQWFTGEMDLGTSTAAVFTIRNEGLDPLVITRIGFTVGGGEDFSVSQGPALPFTLGSYEEVEVEITFFPSAEGLHTGGIVVEYNIVQP